MLIVIEGPSGVGKTSVAKALPGSTYVSESGDSSPAPCLADFTRHHGKCLDPAELFLLYTARTAIKARVATRNAADGGLVVVDRFDASLYVLGAVTLGLDTDFVTTILTSSRLSRGLVPDLTIFLDCPYQTYRDRAERRGDSSILETAEYDQQQVAFWRYFDYADTPGMWIDTSDLTPDQVTQTVLAHVSTYVASP